MQSYSSELERLGLSRGNGLAVENVLDRISRVYVSRL